MKWFKRIGIALAVLLVLTAALATWLLESESGARFALARAKAAFVDKLSFEHSRGALAGPLELASLRYNDPATGIDIRIKDIKVDYALSGLWSRTLHVHGIDIGSVDVALTSVAAAGPAAPAPSLQSLLSPPLAILLDRANVGTIAISKDGRPVFAADSLDLAATWTATALQIQRLALRSADGKLDLSGGLSAYADLRGHAKADFDWRMQAQRFAGSLDIGNDGKLTTLAFALSQPTVAKGNATLLPNTGTWPWTLDLHVPRFDPRSLSGSHALQSLALDLQGSGDGAQGTLTGNVDLDAHRILLDPLRFALSGQTLIVQNLHLRSPEANGTLTASGRLSLDAQPPGGEFDVKWEGVELPADLVGQTLASHGQLHAGGNADKFGAQGEFAIGPPGKLADIAIKLDGTPQAITLHQLDLKQAKGGLSATGEISLQPQVGWNLQATAHGLNPGAFAKDWPGAINFSLSTNGQMEKDGLAGRLKLDKLGGSLRQRPLSGNADLSFAPPLAIDGTLNLASGNSTIALRGSSGAHTDVVIDLALGSLGDWLPQAAGSVYGKIALQGAWPALDARGKINGSKIALAELRAATFKLDANLHDLVAPSGTLNLDANTVSAGGYVFDSIKLDAHGTQAKHALTLDALGPQLGIALALDGALTIPNQGASQWHGTLSRLSLAPKDATPWRLAHATQLQYLGGDFTIGELCLGADNASLCAAGTQTGAGATQAKFSVAHLPLAAIARFASPEAALKLDGEINGNGEVARGGDGALSGRATLASAAGSIAYPDSATQPLIAYRNFDVAATLTPQRSTVDVRGDLDSGGRLDGHLVLGAPSSAGMPLSGNVAAILNNLGFIDLATGQTSATHGKLDAKFTVSGTTAAPNVAGNLTLADFASEVPSAGLKLHDGRIVLHSQDGRSFALEGSIGSGDGKLTLNGNVGVAADASTVLKISGENFLAADIPGAQVRVSPELTLTRNAGKYALSGSVTIPQADIDASQLPGGGAATTSPDIIVTDVQGAPVAANVSLDADITVKLGAGEKLDLDLRQGREVHVVGYGLNGYLSGQFAVQDRRGRATSGRGQIVVDGTYRAYGQNLKIEQGRLLFAGTPIDNPGLDLRATRGFTNPDVTVGLQVRGTAQVPVLTVFSTPAMEQSDALSYLVAGKPLSQLKSGEGDAVGSAARALGTAGGDLLAKSIGSKTGLDDVGVSDSAAVGGAALTVGKYLSPRLYLSYGVGLFTPGEVVTLRYRLTRLFNIEMQNGTLSSRAGINYKIEK